VQEKPTGEAKNILTVFNEKHAKSMNFPGLSRGKARNRVWSDLFSVLKNEKFRDVRSDALVTARLLSRDKVGLDEAVTEDIVENLFDHADLPLETEDAVVVGRRDPAVVHQSQMVLSNLIRQSGVVQTVCARRQLVRRVLARTKTYTSHGEAMNHDIRLFDMRLLFLMTALCPDQREAVRGDLEGVARLGELLEEVVNDAEAEGREVREDETAFLVELLKLAFNLTIESDRTPREAELQQLSSLSASLHRLLSLPTSSRDGRVTLTSHVVNVTTNLPVLATAALLGPSAVESGGGGSTNVPEVFLNFLLDNLSSPRPGLSLKEEVAPVLSVLCNLSRSHPPVRKYLRSVVLPPLKGSDVRQKPEVGSSARAKLVRMLAGSDAEVGTMVAEFLFVLCKENVGRMVKYTGYGNAAGLLASRGLMTGGRGDMAHTFSEDEDTDEEDEDYKKVASDVNPVSGCVEDRTANPMENMTDEQKEYEAMKLVELMDKMIADKVIQPCRIGEDGRPQPVEHVLQLQEEMEKRRQEESDSDG